MKLSILTSVHDIPNEDLRLSLTSSLQQTGVDLELIAVADNATQDNLNVLDEFEKDSRVRVLRFFNKEPMGPGMALNHALLFAKGDYIGVVDGDDFADTNFFGTLLQRAEATQSPVVKGNCILRRNGVAVRPLDICADVEYDHYKFSWQHWSAIYRRTFLQENGIGWFPYSSKNAETLFLAKVCVFTDRIPVVPSVFYNYNRRATSVDADLLTEKKLADSAHVRTVAAHFLLMTRAHLSEDHIAWYIGMECLSRIMLESCRADSNLAYAAAARGFVGIVHMQDSYNTANDSLKVFSSQFPDFDMARVREYSYVLDYMKSKPYKNAIECS